MKHFDGGSNLAGALPEPRRGHVIWRAGTSSASGGLRSLRIRMPLAMAIDILERADLDNFASMGGAVHGKRGQLRAPDQAVWCDKTESMNDISASSVKPEVVHCTVVDIPLNYRQVMARYQSRAPPTGSPASSCAVNGRPRRRRIPRAPFGGHGQGHDAVRQ